MKKKNNICYLETLKFTYHPVSPSTPCISLVHPACEPHLAVWPSSVHQDLQKLPELLLRCGGWGAQAGTHQLNHGSQYLLIELLLTVNHYYLPLYQRRDSCPWPAPPSTPLLWCGEGRVGVLHSQGCCWPPSSTARGGSSSPNLSSKVSHSPGNIAHYEMRVTPCMRWYLTEPIAEEGKPQSWPVVFTFLSLCWCWPPRALGMAHSPPWLFQNIVCYKHWKVQWLSGKICPREFPRANFFAQPLRSFHCFSDFWIKTVKNMRPRFALGLTLNIFT